MGALMQTVTRCEQETIDFAIKFSWSLPSHAVVLLDGELGAGKTCFVRGLCEGLGGNPRQVSSPTFVIMQEYEINGDNRLVHIDAYRLAGEEELESIGWEELMKDQKTTIAIEWASKIQQALPSGAISVKIDHLGHNSRQIIIK